MQYDEHDTQQVPAAFLAAAGWQSTLVLGIVTLVLGLIVSFHPSGSLNVIAVLLGILLIISGLFELVRIFDRAEQHRVWLGVSGLFFIVVGVVLIRHLHLAVAAIGLLVGITWIVQGIAALITAFSGAREGAAWWGLFGFISLIAGIVVAATPVTSVTVLAVLVGIWFIVMGLLEIGGAFVIRHALSATAAPPLPKPRSADEGAASRSTDRQA
jgi:uncharacterized membrane protein HdeD (DUF308 family)